MTKKDYIKFSKMFSEVGDRKGIDTDTYVIILDEVVKIFKEDNPEFSGAAFYSSILRGKDND